MSVINVKESWSGYSWEQGNTRRRAERRFTVKLDDAQTEGSTILQHPDIPSAGQVYSRNGFTDPRLIAQAPSVNPIGPTLYEVSVRYQTQSADPEQDTSIHPLDRPADVQSSFQAGEAPIDETADGKPIDTLNGELYDPPLNAPFADLRLTITRNEADINLNTDRTWVHTVNSVEFMGNPAGTVLLRPIRRTLKREQFGDTRVVYWRSTYTLDFRQVPENQNRDDSTAWHKRVLHKGFIVKVSGFNGGEPFDLGNPSEKIAAQLEDRSSWPTGPITQPAKLDSNGEVIPPDTDNQHFITYQIFDEGDWDAQFGLSDSINNATQGS